MSSADVVPSTDDDKDDDKDDDDDDDYPINTGTCSYPVDTRSAVAQRWFDRGISWVANFHREEAAFCFEQAIAADPACAMAHWGLALAHGPDYNLHQKAGFYVLADKDSGYPSLKVARDAAVRAGELAGADGWLGTPAQREFIAAIGVRYEWPSTPTTPDLQKPYRDLMVAAFQRHPEDALLAAACAESVLNLSPWSLYEQQPPEAREVGAPPGCSAVLNDVGRAAKAVLDAALQRHGTRHLWLSHLKVHFNEMG